MRCLVVQCTDILVFLSLSLLLIGDDEQNTKYWFALKNWIYRNNQKHVSLASLLDFNWLQKVNLTTKCMWPRYYWIQACMHFGKCSALVRTHSCRCGSSRLPSVRVAFIKCPYICDTYTLSAFMDRMCRPSID